MEQYALVKLKNVTKDQLAAGWAGSQDGVTAATEQFTDHSGESGRSWDQSPGAGVSFQ